MSPSPQLMEERYRLVSRATNDAVWDWDLEANTLWWGQTFFDLFGYRPEDLESGIDSWTLRLHPEDLSRVKDGIYRAIEGDAEHWSDEYRFRRADGSYADIFDRGFVLRGTAGKAMRMIGAMQDISARKRAEASLRESEARLSFALERSHTGGWDLDLVDHTAFRTLEHDRLFGYDKLLPEWTYETFLDHVLPEDRAAVDRSFRAAQAGQTDWSFECRIRRVDGAVRWIWAAGGHQRDASGRARRMSGIVQDITERKLAVGALRASEERFRALMEGAADVVTVIGSDGRVTYVNPAIKAAGGYEPAEVVGRNMLEFLHPDDAPAALEVLRSALANPDKVHGGVWRLKRRDGTYQVFESVSRNLIDTPSVGGFVLNLRDIAERRRAEEAQARRAAELEQFHQASVGRELRMIELKKEVNALCRELGRAPAYDTGPLEGG